MQQPADPAFPGRRIRQLRGRKTYDTLVTCGFELLEEREFEAITIADLARAAGYSVGAFYARFRSKDEYFDALIAHHLEYRTKRREGLFATLSDEALIPELVKDLVGYYWTRRRFWRAALIRSIREPDFWEPLRRHGHEFASSLIRHIVEHAARPLTKDEETNVRFAFQVLLGTINNAIINQPGPVMLGQRRFIDDLARAFRLVSDYDRLVGTSPATSGGAARRKRRA